MKRILIIAMALAFAVGCGKQQNQKTSSKTSNDTKNHIVSASFTKQVIAEPLANAKKPAYQFSIDPSKENTLRTETGSKIIIPKNAFVDKNGKPLTGKVDIAFEEFHDASDIILSGIPMNITTDEGDQASFESAGMFRIEGTQNGKEIRLASNKTMEIQMASNQTGNNFNFYEFSESEGTWVEKAEAVQAVVNDEKKALEKQLLPEPTKPIEIKKASSSDFVFDLAIDQNLNPEFSQLDNVMWKSIEKEVETSMFEGNIRSPRLECIDQAQSIFRLTGGSSTGAIINTRVQPVLFGKNWAKANAKFQEKIANYKEVMLKRKAENAKIDRMGEMTRSFAINNFGVYNFDCMYKLKRKVQFNALFFVPALQKVFKQAFLIQGKKRVAIPYSTTSGYLFTFDPTQENVVITLDEDGNVYEFKGKDFNALKDVNVPIGEAYTFRMRTTDFKIKEAEDLKKYLASL